jgi:lipopolysaccharide/colanic/teichoic acid biosynthesis glycosyltransferase
MKDTSKSAPVQTPHQQHLRSLWLWELENRLYTAAKRTLDIVVIGTVLLLFSPLILLIAMLIKLHDGGPVLFWQRRVGLDGKEFGFPKFRSMVVNAEEIRKQLEAQNQHGSHGVTFKMKNDPRITPIGKLLRRTSLDELPQLWCVLRGEMTLVGPRPALPAEVARYGLHERMRLLVTPGLTCIWQVSGRSNIAFPKQVEMDLEYIRNRSVVQDISLLAKTVPAVVSGNGAY